MVSFTSGVNETSFKTSPIAVGGITCPPVILSNLLQQRAVAFGVQHFDAAHALHADRGLRLTGVVGTRQQLIDDFAPRGDLIGAGATSH